MSFKAEHIRALSERYGREFCHNNAPKLRSVLMGESESLSVRVYDRELNSMREVEFTEVVEKVREYIAIESFPTPTRFGQMVLTPNMHVSISIFDFIALWCP